MEPESRSKVEKSAESLPSTDEESAYMENEGVEMEELATLIAGNEAPAAAVPVAPVPRDPVPVVEKIETKKKKKQSFRLFGKKSKKSFPKNKGVHSIFAPLAPTNNSIPSLILTYSQDEDVSALESVGVEERPRTQPSKMNSKSPNTLKKKVGTSGSPHEPNKAKGGHKYPGQEKKDKIIDPSQKAVASKSKDLTFKNKARKRPMNPFSKKKENTAKEEVAVITPEASPLTAAVNCRSLKTVQSKIQDKPPTNLSETPEPTDEDDAVVDAAVDIGRKWELFFHQEKGGIDNIGLDLSQESENDPCEEAAAASDMPPSDTLASPPKQDSSNEETSADCATREEMVPTNTTAVQRGKLPATLSENVIAGTIYGTSCFGSETEKDDSEFVSSAHVDSEENFITDADVSSACEGCPSKDVVQQDMEEVGEVEDKYAVNDRSGAPDNTDWDTDVLSNEGMLIEPDNSKLQRTLDATHAVQRMAGDFEEARTESFVPSFGLCGICIDNSGSIEVTAPLEKDAIETKLDAPKAPSVETESETVNDSAGPKEGTQAVASGDYNTNNTHTNSAGKLSATGSAIAARKAQLTALADNISVIDGAGSFDATEHESVSNIDKSTKYGKSSLIRDSSRYRMIDEKLVDEAELEKQANEFCKQLDDEAIGDNSVTREAAEEVSAITLPDHFPHNDRARTPLSVEFDESEFESMMENYPCGTVVPPACRNARVQKKTESQLAEIVDACDILAACGRPTDAAQDNSLCIESEMALSGKNDTWGGDTIYGEEDSVDPFKILDFFDETSLDDSFWSALDTSTLQTASVHSTPVSKFKQIFKEQSKSSITSSNMGPERELAMEEDGNDFDDSIFDTVADGAEEEDTIQSEAIEKVAAAPDATQSTTLKSATMKDAVSTPRKEPTANTCSMTEHKEKVATKSCDFAIEDVQRAMATLKKYAARHGISEPELLWKIQEEHRKRKGWKATMVEI